MYLMLAFSIYAPPSGAQVAPASQEYQVKAAFLYNFTRFVEWPESAFKDPNADFVIGIVGGNPFNDFLKEVVAGEKVNSHYINVVYFRNEKDITDCHMLYINLKDPDKIASILKNKTTPYTLTISDADNFAQWGGHIRFFKEQERIRLQINIAATKSTRLTISSKLLSVVQIYDL